MLYAILKLLTFEVVGHSTFNVLTDLVRAELFELNYAQPSLLDSERTCSHLQDGDPSFEARGRIERAGPAREHDFGSRSTRQLTQLRIRVQYLAFSSPRRQLIETVKENDQKTLLDS